MSTTPTRSSWSTSPTGDHEYFSYVGQKTQQEAANQAKVDVSEARMKEEVGSQQREGRTLQNAAKIDAETKIYATQRQGEGKKEDARVKAEVKAEMEIETTSGGGVPVAQTTYAGSSSNDARVKAEMERETTNGGGVPVAQTTYAGSSSNPSSIPDEHASSSAMNRASIPTLATISDLMEFNSSMSNAARRREEYTHSLIKAQFDASNAMVCELLNHHTTVCRQLGEKVMNDCNNMLKEFTEKKQSIEASYAELLAKIQTSAPREGTELPQTLKEALDGLRHRHCELPPPSE